MKTGISSYGSGYWYQDLDYVDDHFELNDYRIPSVDCADDVCIKTVTISANAAIEWVKQYSEEPYRAKALEKIQNIIGDKKPDAPVSRPSKPIQPIAAENHTVKPEFSIETFKTKVEMLKIMKEAGLLSNQELEAEKQQLLDIIHCADSRFSDK